MQKATLLCIATAVALAGASTTADAARKLNREEARVARVKEANHRNFAAPRTMKDAERTTVIAKNGTTVTVPEALYSQLGVRTDANGQVEIVEVDGTETAIPASGVSDE